MQVKRIVANVPATDVADAKAFYGDLFGLDMVMDHGWFQTFAADTSMRTQISVATQGGSGTPVPGLSIEVDDLDTALERCTAAEVAIEYGPVDEPWGVRRFYVRDPFGTLVNVLTHQGEADGSS